MSLQCILSLLGQSSAVTKSNWSGEYSVSSEITYTPAGDLPDWIKTVGFIQVEQSLDENLQSNHGTASPEQLNREAFLHFSVDRTGGARTPFFGCELTAEGVTAPMDASTEFWKREVRNSRAKMKDQPRFSKPWTAFFETAAVSLETDPEGRRHVLGCVSWGFKATVQEQMRCEVDSVQFGRLKKQPEVFGKLRVDLAKIVGKSKKEVEDAVQRTMVAADPSWNALGTVRCSSLAGGIIEQVEPQVWPSPSVHFFWAAEKWDTGRWCKNETLQTCNLLKPATFHSKRA